MSASLFLTRADLRAEGCTIERIRAEIEAGLLERVIRGWYCRPGAERGAVKALRLGGRLSCVSALKLLGAWVPLDLGTHVGFPSHASGRRMKNGRAALPADVVAHWHPKAAATGSAFAIPPGGALRRGPARLPASARRRRSARLAAARTTRPPQPAGRPDPGRTSAPALRGRSPERCERVGIESIVRFRLALAGIVAEVQVLTRGRFRLDLVINGWLVLEIDGREPHTRAGAFTRDRVRTATIMREGRIVLQFAYATVMHDWDFVLTAVRDVMTQHAPVRS